MKRMVSYLSEERPPQILHEQSTDENTHYGENRMCECHHRRMSPSSASQLPATYSKSPSDEFNLASPSRLKFSTSSRSERKFDLGQSGKYQVSSNEITFCTTHHEFKYRTPTQDDSKYRATPQEEAKYRVTSPTMERNYRVVQSSPESNISTSPRMSYKSNEIENIEIENFSLRNRCKRLEAIVSQLIESKEKSSVPDVSRDSYRIVNRSPPKEVMVASPYRGEMFDSSKSPSPVYHQLPNDSPFTDVPPHGLPISVRSPPGRPSKPHNNMHTYPRERESMGKEDLRPGDSYKIDRIFGKSRDKIEELINADEMEKQNEIFRMNYYHKTLASENRKFGWHSKVKSASYKPYHTKPDIQHKKHSVGHERKSYGIPYEDIIDRSYRSTSKEDTSEMFMKQKFQANTIPTCQTSVKFGSESKYITESKINHFNSDFYTKLPPKLHIVESQNKSGVTLTWNATSNCDSSLVKSYQLFARELFGYKVGTMKRIGIISASPLPMSCKVEKLKCNIKYKFAVCAVDIYGRFGKMSNFTGKFELKSENKECSQSEARTDGEEDDELRIIIT